jgi:hypothetical protein
MNEADGHRVGACRKAKLPGLVVRGAVHRFRDVDSVVTAAGSYPNTAETRCAKGA